MNEDGKALQSVACDNDAMNLTQLDDSCMNVDMKSHHSYHLE